VCSRARRARLRRPLGSGIVRALNRVAQLAIVPVALVALGSAACGGAPPPPAPKAQPAPPAPKAEPAPAPVAPPTAGPLSRDAIAKVIRSGSDRFQACYNDGLKKNPTLSGQVVARFVIGNDGTVTESDDGGSSLPDKDVVDCVLGRMKQLRFPKPEGTRLSVIYPLTFAVADGDGDGAAAVKTGPFRGCSVAEQRDAGGTGKTMTFTCDGKKLVVTDVPSPASAASAERHLSALEGSFPTSARRNRSTPKIAGRSCWATAVQGNGHDWGNAVVVSLTQTSTRVVACSGTSPDIARWCEQYITVLAKGHAPAALLLGP
jgi:hypothetical protein